MTYQFHHAGIWHLLGNMIFLFVFGSAVNARVGHVPFVLLYLVCGVVAGLAWLAIGHGEALLGASGAVMGVLGAFVVYYPRNEVKVVWYLVFRFGSFYLSAWVLIAIYFLLDLLGTLRAAAGVAYIAHVAGSLIGFLAAAALLTTGLIPAGRGEEPLFRRAAAGRR